MPAFIFPNPINLKESILVYQNLENIFHYELNVDLENHYIEIRIKFEDKPLNNYPKLKQFMKYLIYINYFI